MKDIFKRQTVRETLPRPTMAVSADAGLHAAQAAYIVCEQELKMNIGK